MVQFLSNGSNPKHHTNIIDIHSSSNHKRKTSDKTANSNINSNNNNRILFIIILLVLLFGIGSGDWANYTESPLRAFETAAWPQRELVRDMRSSMNPK